MSTKLKKSIREGLSGNHSELIDLNRHILPNFIIIGAAKSASTTLTTILLKHPDIFVSKTKEPKFFGRHYGKGWDWYSSHFSKGKNFSLRGEGSTMYTSELSDFRHTPALMHRCLPKLKLIYIVRHPMDRIVSQWRHHRGRRPNCSYFTELMRDRDLKRRIVGCSMYYKQLSRFRKFYPDEQIHCMTFEDLLAEPKRSLQQMMIFLGVKPRIKRMLDENGCLPHENEAGAKGRCHVSRPEWDEKVKAKVLKGIRPDAKKMLAFMGKSSDYWEL